MQVKKTFKITVEVPDQVDPEEELKVAPDKDTIQTKMCKSLVYNIFEDAVMSQEEQALSVFGEILVKEKPKKKETMLSYLIREMEMAQDYLLPNSMKHPALKQVKHVQVMRQFMENVCGFHTLNNALLLSEAILSNKPEEALMKIGLIQSRRQLWKFQIEIVDYLLQNWSHKIKAVEHTHIKDLLNLGVLERYQLDILLENYPRVLKLKTHLNKIGWNFDFISIDFAYDRFQFGSQHVAEIDEACNRFLLAKKGALLLAFVGVTNHWVSFVAVRHPGEEKPAFFLLDSRCAPHLNCDTDEEIEAMFEARLQEYAKYGKEYPKPWKRGVWLQSYKDTRAITSHLVNALTGNTMLPSVYQTQQLFTFIRQFKEYNQFVANPTPAQVIESIKKGSFNTEQMLDFMHGLFQWMHDSFQVYLIWQEVYRPLEEFPQYLPDPAISVQILEFLEMMELLITKFKPHLAANEKGPAKDLVYLAGKFRSRL